MRNKRVVPDYWTATELTDCVNIPEEFGLSLYFHKSKDEKRLFLICENGVLEIKSHTLPKKRKKK